MEITRVNIFPSNDEGIAAYASITFDDCFVIHGLVLRINKQGVYSLHMPQKKRDNGMHVDMVLPLDNETRKMIEEKVFVAYQALANESVKAPVSK
jgi:stage V sporulation protein G